MAVSIKEPANKRDWDKFVEGMGFAFFAALKRDIPGTYKATKAALTASNPNPSPAERAGVWLRASLVRALSDLLDTNGITSPLDSEEKASAARDFLAEALALDGYETLDADILTNPSMAPFLQPVIAKVPAFVHRVAPERHLTDAEITARFRSVLRAAARQVYVGDVDFYSDLKNAIEGLGGDGDRDNGWARHAVWIRSLYHSQPIFSPDSSEEIPLAAAYHRLRCYWHETLLPDDPTDRRHAELEEKPERIAHVADLHQSLHHWLNGTPRRDTIRVVAGGPGSGKSSFSRAFASEVVNAAAHRVIYIQLQHMTLGDDLHERIGEHLRRRYKALDPKGTEGFAENPLDWMSHDDTPLLLVFDGLDELSHEDDKARDLARRFIASVSKLLNTLNTVCSDARALILGRSVACAEALKEIKLDARCLVHVAPLIPISDEILSHPKETVDPSHIAQNDEREAFWRRAALARDRYAPIDSVPEAVTAEPLNELNAEPLLLHLLIVSGYTGDKWQEAADNRNRVYQAIFGKIYERDQNKENPPDLNMGDFFTLVECLGLAAWRGNGRTGSTEEFVALRKLHSTKKQRDKFDSLPTAELASVAVQFYTRPDIEGKGFEFIHKSFGEYLAARGLLAAGRRCARLMTEGEEPRTGEDIALLWAQLIDRADLTEEILRFLVDEARLLTSGQAAEALPPLTEVFGFTQKHGMPVQKFAPDATFRDLETMQRCAESALLSVLDALIRKIRSAAATEDAPARTHVGARWGQGLRAFHFMNRLLATSGHPVRQMLGCLDLSWANLSGADLSWANLSGADLSWAILSGADLSWANLSGADLSGAHLSGAHLGGAKLVGADLFLAQLSRADLSAAQLSEAHLGGADMSGADLSDTDLSDWICAGASLRSATLQDSSGLSPASVKSAFGVRDGIGRTILPDGMEPPEHWHVAADATKDSEDELRSYQAAYYAWRAKRSGGA
ncbi:MAG TPA: pentapeptide repeat-containing protein [Amaricoccus sp.]|uniref:pentapeptide repeat-containing protein n=3 Tax=Amaricoccus sp. TaxID=1872485 RepID=UPI002BCE82E6|nr:pentapeptide repeat-containing protein [Amaricoccus sp.]HMR52528.1 pentapeptide repeat-containing protein [Amaricoccus sp.]HMR60542.1 pentapeptide repeat-containing protein [Amaricoccus sp.]HMT99449.1 pentapeptide repeat-containing protein [Amaricoccus sp.]